MYLNQLISQITADNNLPKPDNINDIRNLNLVGSIQDIPDFEYGTKRAAKK